MESYIVIRANAALAVVSSALVLVFAVTFAAGLALASPPEVGAFPPLLAKLGGILAALVFASIAAWGLASGIGVLRRRQWARVSIAIYATLLAFFGGSGFLVMLFMPFRADATVNPQLAEFIRVALQGFYALLLLAGSWWLILFSRESARRYFIFAEAARPARPLSVTVIGCYLLAGAAITALCSVLAIPFPALGIALTGWQAAAAFAALAAVHIYLGSGLLELNERARVWSIVYFCAAGANGAVAMAGSSDGLYALAEALGSVFRTPPAQIGLEWLLRGICAVALALPLWFLILRRAAFIERQVGAGKQ